MGSRVEFVQYRQKVTSRNFSVSLSNYDMDSSCFYTKRGDNYFGINLKWSSVFVPKEVKIFIALAFSKMTSLLYFSSVRFLLFIE
jgi:hypothetical protein